MRQAKRCEEYKKEPWKSTYLITVAPDLVLHPIDLSHAPTRTNSLRLINSIMTKAPIECLASPLVQSLNPLLVVPLCRLTSSELPLAQVHSAIHTVLVLQAKLDLGSIRLVEACGKTVEDGSVGVVDEEGLGVAWDKGAFLEVGVTLDNVS